MVVSDTDEWVLLSGVWPQINYLPAVTATRDLANHIKQNGSFLSLKMDLCQLAGNCKRACGCGWKRLIVLVARPHAM